MVPKQQSLKQTLQIIVDILSFDDSRQKNLLEQLQMNRINWNAIVKVASAHLVLPAVYCRLDQKLFLTYVPEDLVCYLQELTQLNRDRNHTLRTEAQSIADLFSEHKINYVFIKGIALVLGNYYQDPGERMIGDIDILIDSNDLDTAFQLLVQKGYTKFISFDYEVKNFRHRPRQISANHLGAVELHDQILKEGYNQLIDKTSFLAHKQVTNTFQIPTAKGLIWNTILAHQLNDHLYYYGSINLKGIYDVMVLQLNKKPDLQRALLLEKHSSRFLKLASIFLPTITTEKTTSNWERHLFFLLIKYTFVRRMIYRTKTAYLAVSERLNLILKNKSYRTHVLKNKVFR